jgi:hypothetical protein
MKVWHFTPYSVSRNLGAEYNSYMELIPEEDSACLMDGDAMHLVPDFGHIIHEYAVRNPNAVLTCYINRIHELAKGQRLVVSDDVLTCLKVANGMRNNTYKTTPITGSVSGTLLVIPKHIWKKYPFTEENAYRPGEPNILGVDNHFTNQIRANGIQVLRMDSLLIYHQYRLLTNSKEHLL